MLPRSFRGHYQTPVAVFLLGMVSIFLLVAIERINDRQVENYIFADLIMDTQLRTATYHLWLEEMIAGETSINSKGVWTDIERAIFLSEAMLNGGKSDHGLDVAPLQNPELRSRMDRLISRLKELREIGLERWANPEISGIGTDIDKRFNDVFREIMSIGMFLEDIAEKEQITITKWSTRLFNGILLIWAVIVISATLGLWHHELRRKLAEQALQRANDELERRVKERTADLSTAYESLRAEIAERRRAEDDIRLYEEVVGNMPIGLYVGGLQDAADDGMFSVVAANPVAIQSTGIEPEEVLGRIMTAGFFDMLETRGPQPYEEIIRTGKTKVLTGNGQDNDGPALENYFSIKAFPLPNRRIGVLFENITDRIRAEEALRASESRFRRLSLEFHTLLNAIPDRITLLSPDRRIMWANKGAAKTTGGEVHELTGKLCHQAWRNGAGECRECPVNRSFASGKVETTSISLQDGSHWDVRSFPIGNEDGQIVNVIELAADVTEKITLQAEAMRALHLASIGELAAGVAHEINNPISGIINCAELLSEESGKGSRQNDISNRIIKEGARIAGIVRGLLSFARYGKRERSPVHIEDILADSLALTGSQLQKHGIRLIKQVPRDLPGIMADTQQIQQVFLNIINNARYALEAKYPGGHENKVLEIICANTVFNNNPFLSITFTDHGTGISPDIMNRIMLPFFSTKPVGRGTGLGLSISEGIVSDHGGKLIVKSTQGEFTSITILFPALENA